MRMHWFSRGMRSESLWSIVGHRWAPLGIVSHRLAASGTAGACFGDFGGLLEIFPSLGLTSTGSQVAHDWALILGGSQVAQGSSLVL